ncbi:MAG: gliding-motility protein MglA [Alphaproteobacteria bacterium]|nr:gliding-motility protein MglA [Alphaproteobacteria bacterium]
MPYIVPASKTLRLKIVYYGPGLSGKTTNLVQLYEGIPADVRGKLIQLDTETERTLFFDYFPLNLGRLGSYRIKIDFFTVPGQSFYNATRRTVLEGVDGLVFVADSAPRREHANTVALRNLKSNLETLGTDFDQIPLVFQWNKRDAPGALPVELLERVLNPDGRPSVNAVALRGEGVRETQNLIVKSVLQRIRFLSQRGPGRNARKAGPKTAAS